MAHQPTRHEVVVISIQDVISPSLRFESLEELSASEDLGSVSSGTTGHARGSTVDIVSGRNLEVAAFDVRGAEPIEDLRR